MVFEGSSSFKKIHALTEQLELTETAAFTRSRIHSNTFLLLFTKSTVLSRQNVRFHRQSVFPFSHIYSSLCCFKAKETYLENMNVQLTPVCYQSVH